MTTSSWSWPGDVLALSRRARPTTVSGTLLTRITWSIGIVVAEQLLRHRLADASRPWPPPLTFRRFEHRPAAERPVARRPGTHWLCRSPWWAQLVCRPTNCVPHPKRRRRRLPPRALRGAIAIASSSVSAWPVCAPRRTPPWVVSPGKHENEVGAEALRSARRPASIAPWPIATMAITAATPMMMPSMVSGCASCCARARGARRRTPGRARRRIAARSGSGAGKPGPPPSAVARNHG